MDPRERFSQTVEDYRRWRPDYPDALLDHIVAEARLSEGDRVIDVGCGTGISARQLAARGLDVLGVDPNEAMLAAAREDGGGVTYLQGDGETLQGVTRADAIVGGQSFHWLDLDRALPRFAEVLDGGRVIAFWNLRDDHDPFMGAYEALLREWSPEYESVGAEPRARALTKHPGVTDLREASFPHAQRLDRAGFHGRVWSSSYVRNVVTDREAFDRALDALFDHFVDEEHVAFRYRSLALSFLPG